MRGSGSANRSGEQNLPGYDLRLAIPFAKRRGIFPGKARDIGDRFFQIAPEHKRRSVEMRLPEFIAGRDVGDLVVQLQIPKPRRVRNVEVIDRMKIVIEAGLRDLPRRQAASIIEPPLDQQNPQPGFGQIGRQYQSVLPCSDNDSIVVFLQGLHIPRPPNQ